MEAKPMNPNEVTKIKLIKLKRKLSKVYDPLPKTIKVQIDMLTFKKKYDNEELVECEYVKDKILNSYIAWAGMICGILTILAFISAFIALIIKLIVTGATALL